MRTAAATPKATAVSVEPTAVMVPAEAAEEDELAFSLHFAQNGLAHVTQSTAESVTRLK